MNLIIFNFYENCKLEFIISILLIRVVGFEEFLIVIGYLGFD